MRLLVAGYLMWFASSVTFQSSDFQQGEGVPVSVPRGHDCALAAGILSVLMMCISHLFSLGFDACHREA